MNLGMKNYVRTSAWPGESTTYLALDVSWDHVHASEGKFGMDIQLADDPMLDVDANGATLGYNATRKITVDGSGIVTVPEECITGGTAGFSGDWVNNEGDTVTVVNGIITTVVAP